MSFDEPDGYLDDIAETRETEALRRSGDDWSAGASDDDTAERASRRPVVPPDPPSPWRARGLRWLRFTRTLLVTVLVLVGLAGIANVAIHRFPRTTTHTYTYSNIQRVFIAVDGNGGVDIHGIDGDEVTVKATDRATLLEPVSRQIISSGGWLIISVHCPSGECSSKYDIGVPRSAAVNAVLDHSTDQADITATGLNSAVSLFTGHGDVTIDKLSTTADVDVVANGRVQATNVSAPNVDVFAPIGDKIALQVTGSPQNIRVTSGQPAEVSLTIPPGAYNISCQPKDKCTWPGSDVGDGTSGAIQQDPTSARHLQVNVVPQTTANILAGS
jgi:hypothetical protein